MPGFEVFVDKGDLLGIVVSKCDDEPLPDGDRSVNGTISDPIEQEVGSLVRRTSFIRGKPFDADERIVGLNHHGDIVESGGEFWTHGRDRAEIGNGLWGMEPCGKGVSVRNPCDEGLCVKCGECDGTGRRRKSERVNRDTTARADFDAVALNVV